MINLRIKNGVIVSFCLLMFIFLSDAVATTLTFDFEPGLAYAYDFGRANFTTVYGDRGATGSNGTTYSYDGVAADTPNIHIDYGLILKDGSTYPGKWYNNPGKALFREVGYVMNNHLYPSGSTGNQVIMFKPDSGYGITIHNVDVGRYTEGVYAAQVEVWESKTRADGLEGLDISTFVVGQRGLQPYLVKDVDYKVVYFGKAKVNFGSYFPDVSSGKILWLVIGNPEASSSGLGIDNVSFSQFAGGFSQARNCPELIRLGLGLEVDVNNDCKINIDDFAVIVELWLDDNTPVN